MCPDKLKNKLQIVAFIVIAIFIVVMLVRSTLTSSNKIKPAYSVYLKILANHFQILSAIANVNFEWPELIRDYYDSQATVAEIS